MKKLASKTSRAKGTGRKSVKAVESDRDWQALEAQNDRLKNDWMSLAVHLGIGGPRKASFD